MLRGVLLIGGAVGAWAVYNAIAADAAYANDSPCPSVVGGLLDTVTGVDAVLAPSASSTPEQATTWILVPLRSDGALSAKAGKATIAAPGQSASRPAPAGTAVSARAGVASSPSPSVGRAVGESVGGVVTPVATLVEPVTRPVVGAVAPVVGGVTGTGLLAPVVGGVGLVAQPIVDALRPTLDPVLGAARPVVGPLVDVVLPIADPVNRPPRLDPAVPGAISPDAGRRPVPTFGQVLAPAGVHQASDLSGRWVAATRRSAGGDRAGDAAVGAGDPAPIDASASVPRPQGSTTSAGASGAGGGVVADASARPWVPELGIQASHFPPGGKLAGRWPVPGVGPA
jgi:hypothetical protein